MRKLVLTAHGSVTLDKMKVGVWAYHYSNPPETRCVATVFDVAGLFPGRYMAPTKTKLREALNTMCNITAGGAK